MRYFMFLLMLSQLPSTAPYASDFRSGFETGRADAPSGWKFADKGMSAVASQRARSGRRSLKIVDTDDRKLGSSVWSDAIPFTANQDVRLSVWCFLEAGDSRGLGIYIEFQDASGKRVGERDGYRQNLVQGRWNLMITSQHPPRGAVRARAWLHTISDAVITCHVDDVVLETVPREGPVTVSGWDGAILDPDHQQIWPAGVRWEHGKSTHVDRRFSELQDWSRYNMLSFNVYSERITGSSFVMIFASENPQTEGADYYSIKIPVDFKGWKQFRLPLAELRVSRKPLGWQHIESIKLRATGYSQTLNPQTTVVIDGVQLQRL